MREYKTNCNEFARRTRHRVFIEISFIVLVGIFFWSKYSTGLPEWLKLTVILIAVMYVLLGLVLYPNAKSVAGKFTIYLSNESLRFSGNGETRNLPYSDLVISKVLRKHGEVVEIRLKTTFSQTIKLRGLENMEELYSELTQKVKEN